MAEALARGFIDRGVIKAADVHCTDPVQARREVFEGFGCQAQTSNVDVRPNHSICSAAEKLVCLQLCPVDPIWYACSYPLALPCQGIGDLKHLLLCSCTARANLS